MNLIKKINSRFVLKALWLLLALLSLYLPCKAQEYDIDLNVKMLKSNGDLKKGNSYCLKKFVHDVSVDSYGSVEDAYYIVDADGKRANINSRVENCFEFDYKNVQDLWDAQIISNVLYEIKKKGFQANMRQDMELDALDYIERVRKMGLEHDDPYLENYLYGLVAKIAPQVLIDGRPSSINLIVQQSPNINASTYPNGTIMLTTGLLAAIHTEDELVAILAHEIAHFVLDHSVQNVNKAVSRKKRAEFWAGVLTGLTAVAEVAVAANNENYQPGGATVAMAAIASEVGAMVVERLGMNYNHDQEREADALAVDVLGILGYDSRAMGSALSRIKSCYDRERLNVAYFQSYTHPSIIERINNNGKHQLADSPEFEKMVSFAVSNVADLKYGDRRFAQCLPLLRQNIRLGVGTADDYLLAANCLLNLQNTPASNDEVLRLLADAKRLNAGNINIYKVEILAYLRKGKRLEAIALLNDYLDKLSMMKLDDIRNEQHWANMSSFVTSETDWAHRMLVKVNGMN